jgi:hypothetical protein
MFVGKDRDGGAPIAGIKIEMIFGGDIEIGLLKNEGHPQHPFPKVNGGLTVGADQGDVMDALGLDLLHRSRFLLFFRQSWAT